MGYAVLAKRRFDNQQPTRQSTAMECDMVRRRHEIEADAAERAVRLQANGADMEQLVDKAKRLSDGPVRFSIRSTCQTATGQNEFVITNRSPLEWMIGGFILIVALLWILYLLIHCA